MEGVNFNNFCCTKLACLMSTSVGITSTKHKSDNLELC